MLDTLSDRTSSAAGRLTSSRCPRCGSAVLADGLGRAWCSFIGGRTEAPCTWGLGDLDRGSREADVEAWRGWTP